MRGMAGDGMEIGGGRDVGPAPTSAERLMQRAVLAVMLDQWPAVRTIDAIVSLMTDGRNREGEADAIASAVEELARAGLATVTPSGLLPSAAAVRYRLLEEEP